MSGTSYARYERCWECHEPAIGVCLRSHADYSHAHAVGNGYVRNEDGVATGATFLGAEYDPIAERRRKRLYAREVRAARVKQQTFERRIQREREFAARLSA